MLKRKKRGQCLKTTRQWSSDTSKQTMLYLQRHKQKALLYPTHYLNPNITVDSLWIVLEGAVHATQHKNLTELQNLLHKENHLKKTRENSSRLKKRRFWAMASCDQLSKADYGQTFVWGLFPLFVLFWHVKIKTKLCVVYQKNMPCKDCLIIYSNM